MVGAINRLHTVLKHEESCRNLLQRIEAKQKGDADQSKTKISHKRKRQQVRVDKAKVPYLTRSTSNQIQ